MNGYRLPRTRIVFLLLPLLIFLFQACNEPNVRLVNKVKTFSPKWSQLNDKFVALDRNLDIAEEHFEQDYSEIEGLFSEIDGKEKGKSYRKMLEDYATLITSKDTIRSIYTDKKKIYKASVEAFHELEQKVMSADIEPDEGIEKLDKFKLTHKSINSVIDSVDNVLSGNFDQHNAILRDLASKIGIFRNFDIRYQ